MSTNFNVLHFYTSLPTYIGKHTILIYNKRYLRKYNKNHACIINSVCQHGSALGRILVRNVESDYLLKEVEGCYTPIM